MSTISVTVDQPNHATMLAEWLRNIRFVKKVEVKLDKPSKTEDPIYNPEFVKMIREAEKGPKTKMSLDEIKKHLGVS